MIGVDSCPIEGFKAEEIEEVMRSDFGIDTSEFGVACMVAFGFRVNEQGVKTRQDIEDVTEWYT